MSTLGCGVPVLIIGGETAYLGRKATIRASLRLEVGGQRHMLGWYLQEQFVSPKTGQEILWHEKNLLPLTGDCTTQMSRRQLANLLHDIFVS